MNSIRIWTFLTFSIAVATAAGASPVPQAVSYCDLSQNPESYLGKKIVVWASLAPSLNGTEAIFDDNCAERRSMMFRVSDDRTITELSNYRPSTEIKAHPFRIWGDFIGEVVREVPASDPLINDNGYHFVVEKIQNIKALTFRPAS